MLDKLGFAGVVGLLLMLGGVAAVASRSLVIAGGSRSWLRDSA
jgi:hypothetical protein